MSNTYKTNNARNSRKQFKELLHGSNSGEVIDPREYPDVELFGVRYGNNRKYHSDAKVMERRVTRKKLNHDIDYE